MNPFRYPYIGLDRKSGLARLVTDNFGGRDLHDGQWRPHAKWMEHPDHILVEAPVLMEALRRLAPSLKKGGALRGVLLRENFDMRFDAYRIRVRWVNRATVEDEADGDYCRQRGVPTIRLANDLEGEDILGTLTHEVGHAINDLKLAEGVGSEVVTQALGSAMHQLLQALLGDDACM